MRDVEIREGLALGEMCVVNKSEVEKMALGYVQMKKILERFADPENWSDMYCNDPVWLNACPVAEIAKNILESIK